MTTKPADLAKLTAQLQALNTSSGAPARQLPSVGLATSSIKQSELNRLVEQINQLREALEPFALFGDALPPVIAGQPRLTDEGPMLNAGPFGVERQLTFGHVRKAKALLDRLVAEDEQRIVTRTEEELCSTPLGTCRACGTPIFMADKPGLKGFCSWLCMPVDS